MTVWLVLCSPDDYPALWAASRLRARGLTPLLVLTPELLQYSFRWEHRLGPAREPSIAFTLADGRRICGEAIRGVLNRLPAVPARVVRHFPADDRAYAQQEWTALHVSWLTALAAPVLNRPSPQGLGGAWRHQAEWTLLAAKAGLPVRPFQHAVGVGFAGVPSFEPAAAPDSVHTAFVLDDRVLDDGLQDAERAACTRLGRLADTRLLGVCVHRTTRRFVAATAWPDLRLGGEPLVDALHTVLTSSA